MPRLLGPLQFVLLATCLNAQAVAGAAEDDIAVIVAGDAPPLKLDRATLRDIYLKKIFVDERGVVRVPVNLPPDDPLRHSVALALFHEGDDALQRYWNERYFHGVRPPYVLGSQAAVLQFVARTEGAIGYVAGCRLDTSVRAVLYLPVPPTEREAVQRLCAEVRPPGAH